MPYSIKGYENRAQECVRLANESHDALVTSELLRLRRIYLQVAVRLRQQDTQSRE